MKKNKTSGSNWKIKVICFLLAALTYVVAAYGVQQQRRLTLPVDIKMPDNYVAVSNIPSEVELVIQGSEERIYMLKPETIKLSADFSNAGSEGVMSAPVSIDLSGLDKLADLSSISIFTEPSVLKIYFEKRGN